MNDKNDKPHELEALPPSMPVSKEFEAEPQLRPSPIFPSQIPFCCPERHHKAKILLALHLVLAQEIAQLLHSDLGFHHPIPTGQVWP